MNWYRVLLEGVFFGRPDDEGLYGFNTSIRVAANNAARAADSAVQRLKDRANRSGFLVEGEGLFRSRVLVHRVDLYKDDGELPPEEIGLVIYEVTPLNSVGLLFDVWRKKDYLRHRLGGS